MDYDSLYDGVLVLDSNTKDSKTIYQEPKLVYPQNLTLNEVEITNLFSDSTLMNISYQTDVTKESKSRFQRLVTNQAIDKSNIYKLNVDL
jgi:hypothetical protein